MITPLSPRRRTRNCPTCCLLSPKPSGNLSPQPWDLVHRATSESVTMAVRFKPHEVHSLLNWQGTTVRQLQGPPTRLLDLARLCLNRTVTPLGVMTHVVVAGLRTCAPSSFCEPISVVISNPQNTPPRRPIMPRSLSSVRGCTHNLRLYAHELVTSQNAWSWTAPIASDQ